mmetsp:Transcript_12238/g.35907  ORF Transcript_12238/g.35907 Transcript_12238/m.35907 type:complete len:688 (-) Transcript_12238:252-2315(-)
MRFLTSRSFAAPPKGRPRMPCRCVANMPDKPLPTGSFDAGERSWARHTRISTKSRKAMIRQVEQINSPLQHGLQDGPGQSGSVPRASPTPQFIYKYQASFATTSQHTRNVAHLGAEGRFPLGGDVGRCPPYEERVESTQVRLAADGGGQAADRKQRRGGRRAHERTLPAHVGRREQVQSVEGEGVADGIGPIHPVRPYVLQVRRREGILRSGRSRTPSRRRRRRRRPFVHDLGHIPPQLIRLGGVMGRGTQYEIRVSGLNDRGEMPPVPQSLAELREGPGHGRARSLARLDVLSQGRLDPGRRVSIPQELAVPIAGMMVAAVRIRIRIRRRPRRPLLQRNEIVEYILNDRAPGLLRPPPKEPSLAVAVVVVVVSSRRLLLRAPEIRRDGLRQASRRLSDPVVRLGGGVRTDPSPPRHFVPFEERPGDDFAVIAKGVASAVAVGDADHILDGAHRLEASIPHASRMGGQPRLVPQEDHEGRHDAAGALPPLPALIPFFPIIIFFFFFFFFEMMTMMIMMMMRLQYGHGRLHRPQKFPVHRRRSLSGPYQRKDLPDGRDRQGGQRRPVVPLERTDEVRHGVGRLGGRRNEEPSTEEPSRGRRRRVGEDVRDEGRYGRIGQKAQLHGRLGVERIRARPASSSVSGIGVCVRRRRLHRREVLVSDDVSLRGSAAAVFLLLTERRRHLRGAE